MNLRKSLFALYLLVVLAGGLHAQQVASAVVSDPAPDKQNPPSMDWPDVLSHGSRMYSVIYLASGAGAHPTVLLMHGFPGNEQNLDLAQSMRRAGWNVLLPHYRGSWGSEGTFSFNNAIEDTQAAIQFLREPENVKKYRIDTGRIVLIGHSVGGFMAAIASARDQEVLAVGLITANNLGPSTTLGMLRDPKEIQERFRVNASRLAGTSADALLKEARENSPGWNYFEFTSALKSRPVLIVEADDRNTSDNQHLAGALKKQGNTHVTEIHIVTDHVFSDHRIALQQAVVEWLAGLDASAK